MFEHEPKFTAQKLSRLHQAQDCHSEYAHSPVSCDQHNLQHKTNKLDDLYILNQTMKHKNCKYISKHYPRRRMLIIFDRLKTVRTYHKDPLASRRQHRTPHIHGSGNGPWGNKADCLLDQRGQK